MSDQLPLPGSLTGYAGSISSPSCRGAAYLRMMIGSLELSHEFGIEQSSTRWTHFPYDRADKSKLYLYDSILFWERT